MASTIADENARQKCSPCVINKSTEIRTNLRFSCLMNKSFQYCMRNPLHRDDHILKSTKQKSGIESETQTFRFWFSSLLSRNVFKSKARKGLSV